MITSLVIALNVIVVLSFGAIIFLFIQEWLNRRNLSKLTPKESAKRRLVTLIDEIEGAIKVVKAADEALGIKEAEGNITQKGASAQGS